jgi:hypothetical protein
VRPRLARRSDVVLAGPAAAHEPGQPTRRSRVHYSYVGLELVKIAALVISGAAALAGA